MEPHLQLEVGLIAPLPSWICVGHELHGVVMEVHDDVACRGIGPERDKAVDPARTAMKISYG